MKQPFHLFAALGFTSMVGQILLMRELIVVFYGNELSLGIMLGSWLFWVGAGSLIAALTLPRLKIFSGLPVLAILQALLGVISVGTLMCVRALPVLLRRASAGEIVGYLPIIVSSFLVLAPMCLLLGFLFDLFCHVWSVEKDDAAPIGSVYIFESLGAAVGGMAFAWALVWIFTPSEIVFALLLLNLAASAATLALHARLRAAALAVSIVTVVMAGASFFGLAGKYRQLSMATLWSGLRVEHSEDSIYGNIAVTEKQEQKSLYENGLLMFSHPDRFSAEEAVHFALIEHPSAKSVLLIGGGVNGSLNEVLKHPVRHVDYLELDPLTIEMAKRFLPAEIRRGMEDARVNVHTVDGRLFVKGGSDKYDVIIVNLPDPYTALINRFYTLEFFRECRSIMSSSGIISFRVSSAENYISPELQQFLGCIYGTLEAVFPDVKVVPGESNIFLACNKTGILTLDTAELIERLNRLGIKEKLLFIREYYLPFRLSEERKERLASALATAEARLNTDLTPICYYYDAVLWSKQFKDVSSRVLSFFSQLPRYFIASAIAFIFVAALLAQKYFPLSWGSKSVLIAVGTTGFAEITIEVVTLLGFQAIHGYVYYKVAMIVTAFMLGLAIGAAVIVRSLKRIGPSHGTFILIQAMVCAYPLLLLGALILFSRTGRNQAAGWIDLLEAQAAFPLLALTAGFVGGLQFPMANALVLAEAPGVARAAGFTYGIDLIGSCLGAMLTTAVLIPVFGIPFACVTATLLNLGSLLLLLFRRPLIA